MDENSTRVATTGHPCVIEQQADTERGWTDDMRYLVRCPECGVLGYYATRDGAIDRATLHETITAGMGLRAVVAE